MPTIVDSKSLFEIDSELDEMLEQIQEQIECEGEASETLMERFREFCEAHGQKVDRLGRFVRMMEAREQFCRSEAARLSERARAAANKVERTKAMVLFHLLRRDQKRLEGQEFTLRIQKNSQDSVKITDEGAVPMAYRKIEARIDGVLWETVIAYLPDGLAKSLEAAVQERRPDAEAIKAAITRREDVPGAEVRRGMHLRIV